VHKGDLGSNVDDPFGPWSNDKKYTGLRFNWVADNDSVSATTPDNTTVLAGTEFSLAEIFDHYNQSIAGYPSEQGYDAAGSAGDALWNTRTGFQEYDTLYFQTMFRNRTNTGTAATVAHHNPESVPFDWSSDSNHLPVLGGLMNIIGLQTNTDSAGILEDEFYIQCTVMVEGWEEF